MSAPYLIGGGGTSFFFNQMLAHDVALVLTAGIDLHRESKLIKDLSRSGAGNSLGQGVPLEKV